MSKGQDKSLGRRESKTIVGNEETGIEVLGKKERVDILGVLESEASGAQVFFGFDIKTWGNLPSSKRWQMRERGNLRIVFELQWEIPLCDPLIATKLLF